MSKYLEVGITVILISLIMQWLVHKIRTGSPKNVSEKSGTIAPETISAWLTMVFGFVIMLVAIACLLILDFSIARSALFVALALFGAAIAGFMAPSVTSLHILNWNESGVEGPSKTFGPTLGWERTEIVWGDIVRRGETATQYWFIETNDGRRIYWSYLYKGYGAFEQVLSRHCPQLSD